MVPSTPSDPPGTLLSPPLAPLSVPASSADTPSKLWHYLWLLGEAERLLSENPDLQEVVRRVHNGVPQGEELRDFVLNPHRPAPWWRPPQAARSDDSPQDGDTAGDISAEGVSVVDGSASTSVESVKVIVTVEHGAGYAGAAPGGERRAPREQILMASGEGGPELVAAQTAAFIRDACRHTKPGHT